MKTIDGREMQKTTKEKQRQKGARGTEAIMNRSFPLLLSVFCFSFNQLIYIHTYIDTYIDT